MPDEAIGAVGIGILAGRFAVTEIRVEDDVPISRELRHVWPAAPPDDDMSVRKELRIAFEGRQQPPRMPVAPHQGRRASLHVQADDEDAGELLHRGGGAVVEHGDRPVWLSPGVVLPRKAHAAPEGEVGSLAAQAPHHSAGATVDLVDRVCVACGDEQISVCVDGDRVEVQIVVRQRLHSS